MPDPWDEISGMGGLFDPKGIQRQMAADTLAGMAQGLLQASAPSPYPRDLGTVLSGGIGGALQANQGMPWLQRAQAMMQLRQMAQQSAMFPLAMKQAVEGAKGDYSPYGGAAGGPQMPAGAPEPGTGPQTNAFNIGNVEAPKGSPTRFQTPKSWDEGVAITIDNAKAYPDRFNKGEPMSIDQIASRWAPAPENDPSIWAKNVSAISGLPRDEPLNLKDPIIAAKFARGVHGAEKGQQALLPVGAYMPGPRADKPSITDLAHPTPVSTGGGSLPPIPTNAPDPSRYALLKASGPMGKAMAEAYEKRDELRQKLATSMYEMSLAKNKDQRDAARLAVEQARLELERLRGTPEYKGQISAAEARAKLQPDITQAEARAAAEKQEAQIPGKVKEAEALIPAQAAKESAVEEAKHVAEQTARVKAIYGGMDIRTATPEQIRAKANPEAVALVDSVQAGRTRMNDVQGRQTSNGVSIGKNDVNTLGEKLYGNQWNPNAGDIRYEWEKNATDTSHQLGKTLYSINTVYQHIDQFWDLFKALKNKETPVYNEILRAWNNQTGNPKYKSAEALQHALGTEIASVIKGQQLNMPEVEAAVDTLNTTQSPAQMRGALESLRLAMGSRENTIRDEAAAHYVPPERFDKLIGPSARKAIEKFDSEGLGEPKGKLPGMIGAHRVDESKYEYRQAPDGRWQFRAK